jgi:predicted nucleic acid-binding protein
MRVAIDTNVLVYAEGFGDVPRCHRATELIAALNPSNVVLPAQVLGELFNVLTRKAGRTALDSRDAVLSWSDTYDIADSTKDAITAACDLVAAHQLQFWDALIISVSAQQKCRLLITEDLSHGFTWQGLTVVNPFIGLQHPLLGQALTE